MILNKETLPKKTFNINLSENNYLIINGSAVIKKMERSYE